MTPSKAKIENVEVEGLGEGSHPDHEAMGYHHAHATT